MKYLLLTTALLATFASCSKKEPTPNPTPTLEGTWKFASVMNVVTPLLTPGPDITSTTPYGAMEELLTLSSPAVGIAQFTVGGQQHSPTTYSYSGADLTIQGPNYPSYYKVVNLTATDLAFSNTTSDVGHRYVVTYNLVRLK